MKKMIFALSFTVFSVYANAAHFTDRNRHYQHDLFSSQSECDEARKHAPFLNCAQHMTLRTDGSGMVVLTDIANLAKYDVTGDTVSVTIESGGEVTGTLVFKSTDAFNTLTLQENSTQWKLQPAQP